MGIVKITGKDLKIEDVVNVARNGYRVEITDFAKIRMEEARKTVDYYIEQEIVSYGINTGFGKFSDIVISKEEAATLQENLIISHAVGVGRDLSIEIVRAMMLLRVNSIAGGNSGVRVSTVQLIVDLLNAQITPSIPEKGSLGASGDLAPLSHMVLPMLGRGFVYYKNKKVPAMEALEAAKISKISLIGKEGLGLINGTQAMTAIGCLAVYDANYTIKLADVAMSLTLEALNGVTCAMDERVHQVRGHQGQIITAENILRLVENSQMVTKQGELRVQDPYSLRCTPQVHGATRDALAFIKEKIEIEINAVTDNPLIFVENNDVISAGNFHGQPIALPMDYLAIALAELANISERRLERLVNPALSFGLPAFLIKSGGVNSGFMIVQYSAASLVSENKVLAHPASVDSIPSSANQEDHVSMGTIAARKAREVLENVQSVLSMEILAACQAIDLREKRELGIGTKIAYEKVRENVAYIEKDEELKLLMNEVEKIVKNHELIRAVEEEVSLENRR